MDSSTLYMALALAVLSCGIAGCIQLEPCGPNQVQYCTKDDACICGKECEKATACGDGERCQAYRYNPAHGVCIDETWAAKHNVTALSPSDAGVGGDAGK